MKLNSKAAITKQKQELVGCLSYVMNKGNMTKSQAARLLNVDAHNFLTYMKDTSRIGLKTLSRFLVELDEIVEDMKRTSYNEDKEAIIKGLKENNKHVK
ncbi:hypothetical protein ABK933_03615 [Klebsiella aerogenes]|uniref:hypothetical protein n=1 Tax=Klebsiella aerogenes TaxID=548 RepID=UPI002B27A2AE|nr:hypothetical protein [Klebsiella aerogenes]MEA8782151.1 hypothetical protein [Klebsiella aerogenes]HCL5636383.1 hypothetical protein [Klebsiella aerogenes]